MVMFGHESNFRAWGHFQTSEKNESSEFLEYVASTSMTPRHSIVHSGGQFMTKIDGDIQLYPLDYHS